MKARALAELLRLPAEKRLPVVAEGLALLVDHVAELRGDLEAALAARRMRSATVLLAFTREEASKVLILLDLVRMGWSDDAAVRQQLKRFYSHLARGLYYYAYDINPADFREVRDAVDRERRSHYLDGPNDTDWIFRNEFEERREEGLYVDYVVTDEGPRWVTPLDRDRLPVWGVGRTLDLVPALARAGLTTVPGLRLVTEVWTEATVVDATHWQEVRARNFEVLRRAAAAGLTTPDLTGAEVENLLEGWGFPLTDLDLSRIQVPEAELRRQQAEALDRMHRDYYGV